MTHTRRFGAAILLTCLLLGACGTTDDQEATVAPSSTATASVDPAPASTAVPDPEACDQQCRFPTFERSDVALTTADDGNCNATLAAEYGGDCTNFHWLGLMGDPSVLYADGDYTMWFTAGERINTPGEDPVWWPVIARATSTDGMLWSDPKDLDRDTIAVITGGTDGLDTSGLETVHVDPHPDGGFVAYFSGSLGTEPSAVYVIGRATSDDGITWDKALEPVMTPELPWEQSFDAGGFEVGGVLEPTVLYEDGRWRMWYVGFGRDDGSLDYARIGYAESADGITWTRRPEPVLVGGEGFETLGVSHPDVVADPRGGYHMFYVGIGEDEQVRLGHAYSEDGIEWERNPANPIISGVPGEFDAGLVGGPSAVFVGDELQLFHMATTKADFTEPVRFVRVVASN